MKYLYLCLCLCLIFTLLGCTASKEQMSNFGMVVDNLTKVRDEMGGVLIVFVETQDLAVYEKLSFGVKPPVKGTAILLVGVKGADDE